MEYWVGTVEVVKCDADEDQRVRFNIDDVDVNSTGVTFARYARLLSTYLFARSRASANKIQDTAQESHQL